MENGLIIKLASGTWTLDRFDTHTYIVWTHPLCSIVWVSSLHASDIITFIPQQLSSLNDWLSIKFTLAHIFYWHLISTSLRSLQNLTMIYLKSSIYTQIWTNDLKYRALRSSKFVMFISIYHQKTLIVHQKNYKTPKYTLKIPLWNSYCI